MASSVIYKGPPIGSTEPSCTMINPRLQRVQYLDQLSKRKYPRDQNTQTCQNQMRSQSIFYSSEQQNKMLECTNNLIPIGRDFRYSSVSRKNENLIRFVEPAARPLKGVVCFLCNKTIKESHFEEHLFFGGVRCTLCHEQFWDCQEFQLMTFNNKMMIVPCKHSLQYCNDPIDFISGKLLGDSTSCMNGSVIPSFVLKKLSFYVSMLDVLENIDPWRSAIFKCKIHLPSFVINSFESTKSLSNLNSDIGKSIPIITSTQLQEYSYSTGRGKLDTTSKEKFHATESLETSQEIDTSMKENCCKRKRLIPEDDADDLLLSEEYNLEKLEQSVEYVEVADLIKFPFSTCDKKPRPHKKRKCVKSGLNPMVIEKDKPEEQTIGNIKTPENGYYYVVRQAIEECPMCYTVICPSEFTVNIKTFLMTTVCSCCFLTIYINLESRDSESIVTVGIKKAQQPSSSI